MFNYDSIMYNESEWVERYPKGTRGITRWKSFSTMLPGLNPPTDFNIPTDIIDTEISKTALERETDLVKPSIVEIEKLKRRPRALKSPRLFISYNSKDREKARRIAFIANDEGFHFWMDVYNPTLLHLSNTDDLSERDESFLIATVIEMGLLNSCLLYTSPSPRDLSTSRMPSSA